MEKMLGTARKDHQVAISGVFRDLAALSKSPLVTKQASLDVDGGQCCSKSTSNNMAIPIESDDEAFEPSSIESQCTEVNSIMQRVQSMCSSKAIASQNLNNSADIEMEIISSTESSTPIRSGKEKAYNTRKITQSVEVKKEIAIRETARRSSRNVKFSQKEDEELLKGLQKHGEKNWAAIIKDETFDFHPSRTRDSIRVRADSAAFKKLIKN